MRASAALLAALLIGAGPARAEEGAPRVVLRWQAIPGAAAYDLQLAREPSFAQPELELRVELAGHRIGPPPGGGRRFWRVRSVDADGRPGPWSEPKVIDPVARPEELASLPEAEPELKTLDVPPLPPEPPAVSEALAPAALEATAPVVLPAARGEDELRPSTVVPDWAVYEGSPLGLLELVRPGVLLGLRANLLGVDAPEVALEAALPLHRLGGGWRAALRAGWWRERAVVPASVGVASASGATADVIPVSALLLREFPTHLARLYAGAGAALQLVILRYRDLGSLGVAGGPVALMGVGRGAGPGELFGELAAGFGGVDGAVGKLRTGGISFAVGYRLTR